MQNFGASGTHFLQEGRIDWLEFSSERHTYLSESKPNKYRLQVFQGSLDADVEVLEQRMNFELRPKSDSYLLVSEEDPVHRFDILTSVLAASNLSQIVLTKIYVKNGPTPRSHSSEGNWYFQHNCVRIKFKILIVNYVFFTNPKYNAWILIFESFF